jgi:sulfopyruvate decarboxylase alpha subunit
LVSYLSSLTCYLSSVLLTTQNLNRVGISVEFGDCQYDDFGSLAWRDGSVEDQAWNREKQLHPNNEAATLRLASMSWESAIVDGLVDAEIDLVTQLPDGAMDSVLDGLQDSDVDTLRVEREESAIAAASGAWVTGERAAVMCQSSGLANAINAISSLSTPARLPVLALVTRRGDLGEFNVAQVPAGYGLPDMMDEMGVRHTVVSEAGPLQKKVRMAAESAFLTRTPYVVFLDATVTGYGQEAK